MYEVLSVYPYAQPFHNCLGINSVFCKDRSVSVPQTVSMKQNVAKLHMNYSGAVFKGVRSYKASIIFDA